jgi:hypothetical protein
MKKIFIVLIILAYSLALIVISCSSNNNPIIIGLNENIHHDDFEYSVTDFTTTHQIINGTDTISSDGLFYLIHFKVINKALRVYHKWDNSIAYIVDENGKRYENDIRSQKGLDKTQHFGFKEIYNTPHGSTDTTILVFDLPLDVREPYLMVKGEILMGDTFDGARFKRMKVKLF